MEKKNVLIIAYSYPPSNVPAAQRPYTVAKYLNRDVFNVTVIICGNADVSWGTNKDFNPELPGVKLIRVNSLLGRGVSNLKKSRSVGKKSLKNRLKSSIFSVLSSLVVPDQAIFWYPKLKSYVLKNNDLIYKSDVVFTSSPSFSNHLIGKLIKKRNNKVLWVSELRDFHFIETSIKARNIKQLINKRLEYVVLKTADKVSFISHAMKDIYSDHFPKLKDKFGVIYNGFDISDFEKLNILKTQNDKLTIFYAGSFYRGVRSPIPLLRILDELIDRKLISTDELEIRIAGSFENELIEEIQQFKSFDAISFIGNISRSMVLEQIVAADLLWLIVGNKSTHYTGIPIKFFEYLGARRPIINFAPKKSEPTKIIAQHNLGWSIDTSEFNLKDSVEVFEEIINHYRTGTLFESLENKSIPEFDRSYHGILFGDLFNESNDRKQVK